MTDDVREASDDDIHGYKMYVGHARHGASVSSMLNQNMLKPASVNYRDRQYQETPGLSMGRQF
jgi:hypothetical protein